MIELIKYTALILAFLIAIIGHEIMHGLVAKYYGDDTAKNEGRLSINPIKHIDPFGSIVFPIVLYLSQKLAGIENPMVFGWAKPVPVNIFRVVENGGYLAAVWVSLAGVIYNFFIALIASSLISYFYPPNSFVDFFVSYLLLNLVIVNTVLMVFNLTPIPPLDGANALKYLSLYFGIKKIAEFINKVEPYGFIILTIILLTPLSKFIFTPAYIIINLLL